ncbi:MAG: hypothetical protein CL927_16330 [Deltaproteobacteria bacterium]|mgnify:CR=1 FL=1|nr:hypothetical protein [Deltaproteobacteria bacterium]HCH63951.1 hypothetical protein [Deltaproteobacteria bacterium]
MSAIADLAARQLAAYNAGDLDAFVDCYHPEVVVMAGDEVTVEGIAAFRERYTDLFTHWRFGASVPTRVHHTTHCIDLEDYWRIDPETGERTEGRVLVHYALRDDRIGRVRFLD